MDRCRQLCGASDPGRAGPAPTVGAGRSDRGDSARGPTLSPRRRRHGLRLSRVARTLLASIFPAVGIAAAWSSVEDPRKTRETAAVAALALLPALVQEVCCERSRSSGRGSPSAGSPSGAALGALAVPGRAVLASCPPRSGAGSSTSTPCSCPSIRRDRRCTSSCCAQSSRSPRHCAPRRSAPPARGSGGHRRRGRLACHARRRPDVAIGAVALAAALAIPLVLRVGSVRLRARRRDRRARRGRCGLDELGDDAREQWRRRLGELDLVERRPRRAPFSSSGTRTTTGSGSRARQRSSCASTGPRRRTTGEPRRSTSSR